MHANMHWALFAFPHTLYMELNPARTLPVDVSTVVQLTAALMVAVRRIESGNCSAGGASGSVSMVVLY